MYFAPTALLFFVYNQTEYFYEMMRNAVAFLESAIQIIRLETVPFCRTVPVCIGDLNVENAGSETAQHRYPLLLHLHGSHQPECASLLQLFWWDRSGTE